MCYYPLRNIIPTQIPLILLSTGKEQETISPQYVSQLAALQKNNIRQTIDEPQVSLF